MSTFKRLFGGAPWRRERTAGSTLTAPVPGKPTYVDAVAGQVAVDFFSHDNVDGVLGNFLSAVTEGLVKSRQRELVLTLRLGEGEDPIAKMQAIVRFVATVYAWAREGNLVDEGGFTQFGERGLFGRSHSGLLYTDARPLPGVRVPEHALSAIFVDPQEIRAALEYGTYRVLTRIGLQLRLFPYPTWGDLDRPSAMTSREAESQLAKVTRLRAPGVTFLLADQRLRVTLGSNVSDLLKGLSALPALAPFVLLLKPSPSANAVLAWTPGQEVMSGLSPDGSDASQLSGSCLMIVPGGQGDQIRLFEDGYSVRFSSETWTVLSGALMARRPLSLGMAEGMRFDVAWIDESESGEQRAASPFR